MTTPSVTSYVNSRDTLQQNVVDSQARVYAWVPATTLSEIQLEFDDLNEMYRTGKKLRDNICDKVSTAEYAADHKKEFDTLLNSLRNLRIRVMELMSTRQAASAAARAPPVVAGQAPAGAQSSGFKLERIKLPQFSGKFNEWQSFHDLFVSSVHQDNSKSGAEKMLHLKSCLVGDAAAIVSSFQPTDTGDSDAWDLVVKRYSNKREIIFAHIRKFDDLKALQQESSSGLRGISDSVNECVCSLKSIGVPVEHWDLIMIYLTVKKLDHETKKEWLLLQNGGLPKLDDFIEFLESRARALCDSTLSAHKHKQEKKSLSAHPAALGSTPSVVCPHCSGTHILYRCKSFIQLPVAQREDIARNKKLCYSCLRHGHGMPTCPMDFKCNKCGAKHSSLLHKDFNRAPPKSNIQPPRTKTDSAPAPPPPPSTSTEAGAQSTIVGTSRSPSTGASGCVVLLGTFVAHVRDNFGRKLDCRVFLDSGSESNFISEQCADRLGLKREKTCVTINGIGESPGGSATGMVNLYLYSKVRQFSIAVKALVFKKITGILPRAECVSSWEYLESLDLGDQYYYLPAPIDILLGAEVAASIMIPGMQHGEPGSPWAQNTEFGWILSGPVQRANVFPQPAPNVASHHASCSVHEPCLESSITKFLQLEEDGFSSAPLTAEDAACEDHFMKTHYREQGRYVVELPFKQDAPALGSSHQMAIKRLQSLERRLAKQPQIKEEYLKCMRESLASDFMEEVPKEEIDRDFAAGASSYYMPHREVVKDSSTTTKVRIVFDASAKTQQALL